MIGILGPIKPTLPAKGPRTGKEYLVEKSQLARPLWTCGHCREITDNPIPQTDDKPVHRARLRLEISLHEMVTGSTAPFQ
jgi:hypothetical protein